MATLSPGGRISLDTATEEIERLQRSWHPRRSTATQDSEDTLAQLLPAAAGGSGETATTPSPGTS